MTINDAVKQSMQSDFLQELSKLLVKFYKDLKLKGQKDNVAKHRIEGFMLAGTRLGIVEEDLLHQTMEKTHKEVFGMSISERRLQEVKGEKMEVDWQYYDTPISKRKPKI